MCVMSKLDGKKKESRSTKMLLTRLYDYAIGKNGRKPGITEFEEWAADLSFEFGHPVSIDQLRSKWDRFRKLFDKFKTFKDNTGLGWNPVTKTGTCSDEFWDEYVRVCIQQFVVGCLFTNTCFIVR